MGTSRFLETNGRYVRSGKSAPYFHDGRYSTLEDLVNGPMGKTRNTPESDRLALVAYLRSL